MHTNHTVVFFLRQPRNRAWYFAADLIHKTPAAKYVLLSTLTKKKLQSVIFKRKPALLGSMMKLIAIEHRMTSGIFVWLQSANTVDYWVDHWSIKIEANLLQYSECFESLIYYGVPVVGDLPAS